MAVQIYEAKTVARRFFMRGRNARRGEEIGVKIRKKRLPWRAENSVMRGLFRRETNRINSA